MRLGGTSERTADMDLKNGRLSMRSNVGAFGVVLVWSSRTFKDVAWDISFQCELESPGTLRSHDHHHVRCTKPSMSSVTVILSITALLHWEPDLYIFGTRGYFIARKPSISATLSPFLPVKRVSFFKSKGELEITRLGQPYWPHRSSFRIYHVWNLWLL